MVEPLDAVRVARKNPLSSRMKKKAHRVMIDLWSSFSWGLTPWNIWREVGGVYCHRGVTMQFQELDAELRNV